ncbi:hypothetical protein [Halalkalibacillus sediminis]|uniref:hypothetical protein n=1 Tax=Halalkalibacillus sediminis TaxID=2018042 RepID=UPI0013905F2A|nr:hypothetical protein [Halalkalibacillus sediminis]
MKVKIIQSFTGAAKLEKKVNEFIIQKGVEVVDIQFSTSFWRAEAMIMYHKKEIN